MGFGKHYQSISSTLGSRRVPSSIFNTLSDAKTEILSFFRPTEPGSSSQRSGAIDLASRITGDKDSQRQKELLHERVGIPPSGRESEGMVRQSTDSKGSLRSSTLDHRALSELKHRLASFERSVSHPRATPAPVLSGNVQHAPRASMVQLASAFGRLQRYTYVRNLERNYTFWLGTLEQIRTNSIKDRWQRGAASAFAMDVGLLLQPLMEAEEHFSHDDFVELWIKLRDLRALAEGREDATYSYGSTTGSQIGKRKSRGSILVMSQASTLEPVTEDSADGFSFKDAATEYFGKVGRTQPVGSLTSSASGSPLESLADGEQEGKSIQPKTYSGYYVKRKRKHRFSRNVSLSPVELQDVQDATTNLQPSTSTARSVRGKPEDNLDQKCDSAIYVRSRAPSDISPLQFPATEDVSHDLKNTLAHEQRVRDDTAKAVNALEMEMNIRFEENATSNHLPPFRRHITWAERKLPGRADIPEQEIPNKERRFGRLWRSAKPSKTRDR